MNYINTFIEIAADCKATEGTQPKSRAGNPTVAELEFEFISHNPYSYTQEDVQFHVHAKRQGFSAKQLRSDGVHLREVFFSEPMACMRASPLAKTYEKGVRDNTLLRRGYAAQLAGVLQSNCS